MKTSINAIYFVEFVELTSSWDDEALPKIKESIPTCLNDSSSSVFNVEVKFSLLLYINCVIITVNNKLHRLTLRSCEEHKSGPQ